MVNWPVAHTARAGDMLDLNPEIQRCIFNQWRINSPEIVLAGKLMHSPHNIAMITKRRSPWGRLVAEYAILRVYYFTSLCYSSANWVRRSDNTDVIHLN